MTLFEKAFGRVARFVQGASGRVNLIGEHTDYNGGFVLPTVIPQMTWISVDPVQGETVRLVSSNLPGQIFEYRLGEEARRGEWTDYIQGVTQILTSEEFTIEGFDLQVSSEVPIGSGLSSSAALEVAVLRALRSAFKLGGRLDDLMIARLSQRVENEFVGARVGIMDPMAASLAEEGSALFIDTRTLAYEKIPIPRDQMELIVIHSGISHRNVGGGYNQRRRECEEASRLLGVLQLRDIPAEELQLLDRLPEPFRRRARHVVSENGRVLEAVSCLRAGDIARLGELFRASHESMRDDYEVSIPEIDTLVEIANRDKDVWGARLTGGGFGGSIVAIARAGKAWAAASRITSEYKRATGIDPALVMPQTGGAFDKPSESAEPNP